MPLAPTAVTTELVSDKLEAAEFADARDTTLTIVSVISFLAEHTWLLILAVVAFHVEKLLQRRR